MLGSKIPCLILGYSRVESLLHVLVSASKSGFSPIYISIDGPASDEVFKLQERLKGAIAKFASNSVTPVITNFGLNNLGVAGGVMSGIDWFFAHEDFGAILEDDLEFSTDLRLFFQFGEDFLNRTPSCLIVSGCRFSAPTQSASLTSYPLIWGWATNQKNWKLIRKGIVSKPRKMFSFNPIENYWLVGTRRVHSGDIDTWDIPFAYFSIKNNFSCLIPPVNLTTNVGVDDHAVHTKTHEFPLGLPHARLPKNNWSNVETADSTQKLLEDRFLEKYVFNIKWRHSLSSLKYWLGRLIDKS